MGCRFVFHVGLKCNFFYVYTFEKIGGFDNDYDDYDRWNDYGVRLKVVRCALGVRSRYLNGRTNVVNFVSLENGISLIIRLSIEPINRKFDKT